MSTAWSFRGTGALVTGAASGIGRATATALRDSGVEVLLLDQDATVVAEVGAELGARYGRADISDAAQTSAAVAALTADRPLSYVAHCAGIHQSVGVREITAEDWTRMLGVNLVGAFNVARACEPYLRQADGPAIVNVTSIEAVRVVALVNPHATPHYAAAKAGLTMLTNSLAHEFASDGIRVNAVAPGPVDTPMARANHGAEPTLAPTFADHLLIKRYARADEIAEAICFLLSDSASYITATTLTVDGGYTAV